MVTSPLIAFAIAFLMVGIMARIFRRLPAWKANRVFRSLQIISSSFFSISHGANDAQKAMGIITILLYKYGYIKSFSVPVWVMILSYFFLSFGTLLGGWKIVWAWIVTMPAAALFSSIIYFLVSRVS